MTRKDAERVVRRLATDWAQKTDFRAGPNIYPDFEEFLPFVRQQYPDALNFRPSNMVRAYVEGWFEDELKNFRRIR